MTALIERDGGEPELVDKYHPTRTLFLGQSPIIAIAKLQRAIYQGCWKLISATAGQSALYNLSRDPNELQNLYRMDDPVSRQLSEELEQWEQAIPHRKTSTEKLAPETLERLRSLGYVQ